ncbi:hypothetical protein [Komagataeibacter swingsii]|uniref:hypothetical protein n=1 Tax=Komagataeibacter swingsii TaxID=215220 RepID=UPI0011B4E5A0|nr:hypothetical protein [Komagataeibacter swingsii]
MLVMVHTCKHQASHTCLFLRLINAEKMGQRIPVHNLHFLIANDIRFHYKRRHSRHDQAVFPTVDFPAHRRENSCGIAMPHSFFSCRDHANHE